MEMKGREKVVAWRRVERTAIDAVIERDSRTVRSETGCRCKWELRIFTLYTISAWVRLYEIPKTNTVCTIWTSALCYKSR